jgi:hypothetical protein
MPRKLTDKQRSDEEGFTLALTVALPAFIIVISTIIFFVVAY